MDGISVSTSRASTSVLTHNKNRGYEQCCVSCCMVTYITSLTSLNAAPLQITVCAVNWWNKSDENNTVFAKKTIILYSKFYKWHHYATKQDEWSWCRQRVALPSVSELHSSVGITLWQYQSIRKGVEWPK